jgi:hypothetical protein
MADDGDIKSIKKSLSDLRTEAKDYRDIMEDNETFMDMIMSKRAKQLREDAANHKKTIRQKILEIRELKTENAEANKEKIIQLQREIAAEEDAIEALDAKTEAQDRMTAAVKKSIAETMQLTQVYGDHEIVNIDLIARMAKFGASLTSGANVTALFAGAIGGLVNTMLNLVFQVDEASSSLMRATGINREMADAVFENQQELARFGVSIEDQSKAFQGLFSTYTDFTLKSGDIQAELKNTTALLGELGIGAEAVGSSIQNTTKFFGQTGVAAAATARDLADFASIVGVAPEAMASAFDGAGESLAKLGSNGVRAFKDLAVASKITGIEINKLMQITDKFDTFEGAAEQAGKLNAALGGNFVNAMDLMTATDPIERFQMLRDSILNTGLTFDDMSYYQRKFFTEAAGLENVGDLAKMMSGDFTDLAGAVNMSSDDYADLEEKAKAVQSIQEELQAIMQSFIPVLQDVLVEFRDMAQSLEENEAFVEGMKTGILAATKIIIFFVENIETLGLAMGAAGLVGIGSGVVNMFRNVASAASTVGGFFSSRLIPDFSDISVHMSGAVGSGESLSGTLGGIGEGAAAAGEGMESAGEGMSSALETVGESAEENASKMKSLALVILAIGISVAAAAFGMSYLVEAFGQAGDNATAAVFGILAVGAALAALTYIAIGASAPLAISAGSILAIGAAVAIAAFGMSFLVKSFSGLGDQAGNMMALSVSLAALAGSILLIGKFMTIAGPGFGILILGITALSIAMANMNSQPLADFTANLDKLIDNIDGLKKVKTEIVAIANAMEKIPAGSGMAIQTTAATAIMAGNMGREQSIMFKPEQTFNLEIDGTQIRTVIKNIVGEEVQKRMQQE